MKKQNETKNNGDLIRKFEDVGMNFDDVRDCVSESRFRGRSNLVFFSQFHLQSYYDKRGAYVQVRI